MAQLMTVRLSRDGGNPWGFRLQGGKDFGTPLVIQKVNGGSPAERAGLIAGDSVIKVNTTDVFNLRHKDAQDVIVRAGQAFELTIQRGGSTWKPAVTPVGSLPRSQPVSNNISPVTKTSLAAKNQDYTPIGSSHNVAAKGFAPAPHMNGDGPKLVNKQYNSPIGLYSEQSIAETLSAQSEVLSTGAMGVNFKKNEKNYDAEKSEVYKMLQENEREPRTPEPARHDIYSTMSHAIGGHATSPRSITPVPQKPQLRHDTGVRPANVTNETQGNPTCSECERLIVGVFVRIKDKNLHVECFKCATCGSSLKNVGYYNINNKLYCDIHAKLAARSNPPAPNMVPVTVPPGGRVPAGTISAALSSHSLPSPSPLSPSGNQVAAPFSPHSKQDSLERFSPNNIQNPQKVDAVANLMSALNMVTQREYKENGTNTDSVFLTEKIIPINNNDNNGLKEEHFPTPPPLIKYMPFRPKSGSSFSGPKPFSSVQPSTPSHAPSHAPFSSVLPSTPVAAPISSPLSNTLPRSGSAATMPERKEWPPSKPDELPTASPLYIDPSSRGPTPQPKISSNPHPQPSQILIAQNAIYHPASQNPLPQITISQNPPPTFAINETKMSKSQVEELSSGSDYKSAQEIRNISQNIDRNMSICSAEVTNITGRRSVVECVETVSGAIDTQMLVNNVTKIKERPKSPPPLHRKASVYDTQDISIVVSTQSPGNKNPTTGNPVITVDDKSDVNIKEITHSSCNPENPEVRSNNPGHNPGNSNVYSNNPGYDNPQAYSNNPGYDNPQAYSNNPGNGNPQTSSNNPGHGNPQVCSTNPGHNQCPMSNPDCAVKIVTCPRNNPNCQMNVQSTTNVESTANVQGTSKVSEMVTASKTITNPVPQGYISPMVKALTIASDRPFNTVCVEIKSKEYGTGQTTKEIVQTQTTSSMQTKQEVKARQEVRAVQETRTVQENRKMQESIAMQEVKATQEMKAETRFPHARAPVAASPLASALTVAPSKPFTPTSQISMDPVPLPPESTPYFPPEIPITVEPKVQKQPDTCQSPFVQALTTAPGRPYTPLAGTGQEQSDVPDFMKDVPPPSRQKMSMLSALTTASDRSFTPALSVGSIEDVLKPEPPKPQPKKVPPPPPMPVTIKPASHSSPSAFRPIGNSSFKPVAQTYKPQPAEIPKVVSSFPPISDELKSSYTSSQGFGYTAPSKISTMQNTRMQSNVAQQQQQIHQMSHMASQQDSTQYSRMQSNISQIQQYQHQQQQQIQQHQQQRQEQIQQHHQQQQQQIQQHQQQQQQQIQQHQQQQQQQQYQQQQHMSHMTSQHDMSQYSNQIRQENIQQGRKQSLKSMNTGLHAASSIPGYQKNLSQKGSEQEQLFVPQLQAPIQPIQKPVTTLKPGQYQPNNHLQTFQPVVDENNRHYMRSSSPIPRAISPSLINKPAPSIPYYQADLVAHECQAVETNLFDPRSPAISRSPSPCPGARSTSPFPRTMIKSPAQGPPPNPLIDRVPKPQVVRDGRYLEAKQNLSTYIPKYQGRVEQVKCQLTMGQGTQSRQLSGQSQMMSGQSQVVKGQSQFLGGQAQIATQSQNYQNVQLAHNERQQQNQMYKMSEAENIRHMEQLNKSQLQSVETSAENRIQIQRTKKCIEEYERTQKEKTIEIQRTGSGQTYINQNVSSVGGGASSLGFQRQTSLNQPTPSYARAPQKPFASVANPRSNSLPGSSAGGPKQFKPSPLAAAPKTPVGSQSASRPNVPQPYAGAATGRQAGAMVAPKRGRGILNLASAPGSRVPLCGHCNMHIRGPFITALGKIWCPEHFICTTPSCRRPLQDMGFVEEKGSLYCEFCFEQYLAPFCAKCNSKIKGDCLNAIGKHFHPECFTCAYCSKLFGNSPFFLEDGLPYCEADWNELFTTKCFACGFPVEAGDRWVEALNNNYHSQCFNCTMCKKNLEGQSFYAKGGRPFCKNHAR